jgi:hypothetical protein
MTQRTGHIVNLVITLDFILLNNRNKEKHKILLNNRNKEKQKHLYIYQDFFISDFFHHTFFCISIKQAWGDFMVL